MRATDIQEEYAFLPDMLAIVSEEALLTEATVLRILEESGRGKDFVRNPQLFMEQFIEIVKDVYKRQAFFLFTEGGEQRGGRYVTDGDGKMCIRDREY